MCQVFKIKRGIFKRVFPSTLFVSLFISEFKKKFSLFADVFGVEIRQFTLDFLLFFGNRNPLANTESKYSQCVSVNVQDCLPI